MTEPIIGYKSGGKKGDYLITLKIDPNESNLNRKNVVNKDTAKYRCRKAFVVEIQHKDTKELVESIESNYDACFIYKKGTYVEEPRYNEDIENVCSYGIHFYLTKEPAVFFEYIPKKYNIYKRWYANGKLKKECGCKNGENEGPYKLWYVNGQLEKESEYKDGKLEGPYRSWHANGQLYEEGEYKDGKYEGPYKAWHYNRQLFEDCKYKDGTLEGPYKTWYENGQLGEVNIKMGH